MQKISSRKGATAYFICVLALTTPEGKSQTFEGRVDGTLAFPPRGLQGFGYDPIFVPEGHAETFAEMEPAAKHAISHRARAFEKFTAYLAQVAEEAVMKLLVFAASHRKQSINRKLAALAAGIAEAEGHSIDFPEYGEFDMPIYDDETFDAQRACPPPPGASSQRLKNADGIIISSPEYNWSFPGSLKNIIDWASVATPNPFMGKTALLLSASPSLRGGAQGLVHLKVPLESLWACSSIRAFSPSGVRKRRLTAKESSRMRSWTRSWSSW